MLKIAVKCAAIIALAAVYGFATRVYSQTDSPEMLATGAKLYATYCQSCHGDRQGNRTIPGTSPHNEKGHTWHHPDIQLKEWTLNGKPGFPQHMPTFKGILTKKDVEAILTLIKTWWTPEQREIQADISRRYEEAIGKQKKAR